MRKCLNCGKKFDPEDQYDCYCDLSCEPDWLLYSEQITEKEYNELLEKQGRETKWVKH